MSSVSEVLPDIKQPQEQSKLRTAFDKLLPPEDRKPDQVLTVLNDVTAARFINGLFLASKVSKDPGANWKEVAVTFSLDKESALAKLGDLPVVGETFKKLGFRRSRLGKLIDPAADKLLGARMLKAGVDGGAVPGWLGKLMLTQKAASTAVTLTGVVRGREMDVTRIGQIGEATTDVGVVTHLAAESIDNPVRRRLAHLGANVVTLAGVGMATYALVHDYIPQALGSDPEANSIGIEAEEFIATTPVPATQ